MKYLRTFNQINEASISMKLSDNKTIEDIPRYGSVVVPNDRAVDSLLKSINEGKNETKEGVNVEEIINNLPNNKASLMVTPAIKWLSQKLEKSGAPLETEIDKGYRGNTTSRLSIRNLNNGYELRISETVGSLSSDPNGIRISLYNGERMDELFKATPNTNWYNKNGMSILRNGYFSDSHKFLPYPDGMQDGYMIFDQKTNDVISQMFKQTDIVVLDDTIEDLWDDFAETVLPKKLEKEKQGKNNYPRISFLGLDVWKPQKLREGRNVTSIPEANKYIAEAVSEHNFWDLLTSSSSKSEAESKLMDKLRDTSVPLKERLKSVVKYTKPEDISTKKDNVGPHATSGTSEYIKSYDLGMLEESPTEIKKVFNSISDSEWEKIASEIYGGALTSIKLKNVELRKSLKSEREEPNLFNQNKLEIVIDYNSTLYYN